MRPASRGCPTAPGSKGNRHGFAGSRRSAIEAGTIDGTDPTLKERVAALKAGRDKAVEALDYAKKSSANPIEIDPIAIDRFTRLMREELTSGDVTARKAYLSSVVDAIIVSEDKIRIVGSNDNIRSTFGPRANPRRGFVNLFRNGAP